MRFTLSRYVSAFTIQNRTFNRTTRNMGFAQLFQCFGPGAARQVGDGDCGGHVATSNSSTGDTDSFVQRDLRTKTAGKPNLAVESAPAHHDSADSMDVWASMISGIPSSSDAAAAANLPQKAHSSPSSVCRCL